MARMLLSIVAAAALIAGASAALPQCLLAKKPASASPVMGGTPKADGSFNCATITARNNTVNYVELNFDSAMLEGMDSPVLEVVYWNIQGDYDDPVYKVEGLPAQTQPGFSRDGAFFVAAPNVDQRQLTTNPKSLGGAAQPPNGQWAPGTGTTRYWTVQEGSSNDPVVVGAGVGITTLCAGKYRLVVNALGWTSGRVLKQDITAGIIWRLLDSGKAAQPPGLRLGARASVVNTWFPGSDAFVAAQIVGQSWADQRYMIQGLTVEASGNDQLFGADRANPIVGLSVIVGDGSSFGGNSNSNTTVVTDSSGAVAVRKDWYDGIVDYLPNGGGTPDVDTSQPTFLSLASATGPGAAVVLPGGTKYQFQNVGPFVDVTLSLTRAVEFPSIGSRSITLKDATADAKDQEAIVMARLSDPLVFSVTAEGSGVTGRNNNTGLDTVMLPDSSFVSQAIFARAGTTQSRSAFVVAGPAVPPHILNLRVFTPEPNGKFSRGQVTRTNLPLQWAGDVGLIRPYVIFFRIARGPLCGDFSSVTGTVKFATRTAKGECASNYDCVATGGPHPAQDRAQLSANGDASRFSTCYLVAKQLGVRNSAPITQCSECVPGAAQSDECRPGQFCFADNGVCTSSAAGDYLCDAEAATLTGICRNKSTQVLGQRCRTVAGGVVTSPGTGPPGAGSSSSDPSTLGAVFRDDRSLNGFAPGSGFCGEVRTYNDSSISFESDQTALFKVKGTARTVLWEGACVMGQCLECNPRSTASSAETGKACVNGRLVEAITIDNTARTIVFNAQASAAACAAAFLVLLMALQLCSMQNASNRHRELFGEGPLSVMEVVLAGLYQWMCCCKSASSRAKIGPYARMAGVTSSTPLAPERESVVNPLEGKGAEEWGARH